MNYSKHTFTAESNPKTPGLYQIQVSGMACDCCWISANWNGGFWRLDHKHSRIDVLQVNRWRGAQKKSADPLTLTSACARTHAAIQTFAHRMEACCTVRDGVLTARIIGEFSSGKTRLLHELLNEKIPHRLFPVSSLERQTKLQLEVTYGPQASLSLIERAQDTVQAKHLEYLSDFPSREDIDDTRYDPRKHRLRLSIPEERLLLPDGDGLQADRVPMRLFLIDTPGWNSGDDEMAEDAAETFLTGYHNLALVYVSSASRVDGVVSAQRLREFMTAMDNADFLGTPSLLFIVTHCPSVESTKLTAHVQQRVEQYWQEIAGNRPIDLHVMCIDFGDQSQQGLQELERFKSAFWQHLLAPLNPSNTPPEHPWLRPIRQWSEGQPDQVWDIRSQLRAGQDQLQKIASMLLLARQEDEFLHKFNMTRLLGCSLDEIRAKVRARWLQQVEIPDHQTLANLLALPSALDPAHPLADWWNTCWRNKFQYCLNPVTQFVARFELALAQLSSKTEDLNAHFDRQLEGSHAEAQRAFDCSFTRMVEVAATLSAHEQPEKVVATVLTLSLLEARYCDHYETATARLAAISQKGT